MGISFISDNAVTCAMVSEHDKKLLIAKWNFSDRFFDKSYEKNLKDLFDRFFKRFIVRFFVIFFLERFFFDSFLTDF